MLHLVQKALGRNKSKDMTKQQALSSSSSFAIGTTDRLSSSMMTSEEPEFPYFSELNDDLKMIILSFIADGPYESKVPGPVISGHRYRPAALTTSLPLVNQKFHAWSKLDYYWKPALIRQLANEEVNHLWKDGLKRLLPRSRSRSMMDNEVTDLLEELIKNYNHHHHHEQQVQGDDNKESSSVWTYKDIYRLIFTHHIKLEAPIFIMPCEVHIGEVYGLHLFEPRYRIMIRELMAACGNPVEACKGGCIQDGRTAEGKMSQPPLMIHACLPQRMRPGELACLVQVVWCRLYEHGTADVQLLPIAWVRMDNIWVRPSYGNLFYAKATRI